jgi:hypothetical protein
LKDASGVRLANGQNTIVERGALLESGAQGYVIVWSDGLTRFNGNIKAGKGFVEVSGKSLAADISGIFDAGTGQIRVPNTLREIRGANLRIDSAIVGATGANLSTPLTLTASGTLTRGGALSQ